MTKLYCPDCKHYQHANVLPWAGTYISAGCRHPEARHVVGYFIEVDEMRRKADLCGMEGSLWEKAPPPPPPKPEDKPGAIIMQNNVVVEHRGFWRRIFSFGSVSTRRTLIPEGRL